MSTKQNPIPLSTYVRLLKRTVEELGSCWVAGELQQFKASGPGHWYFTIRDKDVSLDCAMWRAHSSRVSFRPEPGMLLSLYGAPSVYPKQGRLQFYVKKMVEKGSEGALLQAFRQLKAKLEKEGLFDAKRKRPLPQYPRLLGVVTSAGGAAFQDILRMTRQRFPLADIVLISTLVQGERAAPQVAKAIDTFNQLPANQRPDMLIVGRGGGSVQDLQAFNEEVVARAIFASKIPIISAVGHETDETIADFVSDLRAATPSHAAEQAVPDLYVLENNIRKTCGSMESIIAKHIETLRQRVCHITDSYEFNTPVNRVREAQRTLEDLTEKLHANFSAEILKRRHAVEKLAHSLAALDPQRGLRQGLVRIERDGIPMHKSADLVIGDCVQLHFIDGRRDALIDS